MTSSNAPRDPLDLALDNLLSDRRTGDLRADLINAAVEAMARRERNSVEGGFVIAALVSSGMSYRDLERATGIPRATAQRWAAPPEKSPIDPAAR